MIVYIIIILGPRNSQKNTVSNIISLIPSVAQRAVLQRSNAMAIRFPMVKSAVPPSERPTLSEWLRGVENCWLFLLCAGFVGWLFGWLGNILALSVNRFFLICELPFWFNSIDRAPFPFLTSFVPFPFFPSFIFLDLPSSSFPSSLFPYHKKVFWIYEVTFLCTRNAVHLTSGYFGQREGRVKTKGMDRPGSSGVSSNNQPYSMSIPQDTVGEEKKRNA